MTNHGQSNKLKFSKLLLIVLIALLPSVVTAQREEINFNKNWKFILEDNPLFSNSKMDESKWASLNVPHDWAFNEGISKNGIQGDMGGYHGGGIGWYRKSFTVQPQMLTQAVYIDFDGVYMNSEVWINGNYLGKRPYGYISFRYEISKYLINGSNTLAVRVDNSLEPSTRWYHPCGIYAPVRLMVANKVHFAPNTIYVTTPQITKNLAQINIQFKLEGLAQNEKGVTTETMILSPDGKLIQKATHNIEASNPNVKLEMNCDSPELWGVASPKLYTLVTKIISGGTVLDEVKTKFGIRSVEWKTETGFWLNGENIKLKGVAEHYEGGPVGGAWTKPLLRWKINKLREMGVNAIRVTVKPFPKMFYDMCDEMGVMVVDEIFDGWSKKAPYDYGALYFDEWWQKDVEEWITRDRNHPSIVIWGVGNETDSDIAPKLVDFVHQLDPSRKVTSGTANSDDMDVRGVNGGSERKSFFEEANFTQPFISTEAPHTWQTRGYYRTQTWWRDGFIPRYYEQTDLTEKEIFFYEWAAPEKWGNRKQHFNSSYDNATVRISARKSWELTRDLPWYAGQFRWTGFDYYGESEFVHGGWPFNLFMSGALDVAGFEKDLFYFYQSQWITKPMAHLLPVWTHPNMKKGTLVPVWVYSNADEVELLFNGVSLGKDKPGKDWNTMQCEWKVPYFEGKLEAIAYIDGKKVATDQMVTATEPVKLYNTVETLKAEEGYNKVFIVSTSGQDKKNNLHPYANNKVYYHLSGGLQLISLENGNPLDTISRARSNFRALFMGKTRAFVELVNDNEPAQLVLGAILGDKSLYSSKTIALFAETKLLNGNTKATSLQIKYTINGSDPFAKGLLYSQPFAVVDGTKVRAVVIQNNQVLFTMEETFGKKEGLYFGDENTVNPWGARGYTLQAEDASYTGAKRQTVGKNYSGEAFLEFNNNEGSVIFYQENDGSEGIYNLNFRFAHNKQDGIYPMELIVNNSLIQVLNLKSTGSWDSSWQWLENTIPVKLNSGANHIQLKSTGKGSPNIDALKID